MLEFQFPTTEKMFAQRNSLLQESLRPNDLPFTIDKEYPIVLDPSYETSSVCVISENQIIAHANLWPRILTKKNHNKKYNVGLIGNVATNKKYRGQGVMTKLLTELTKRSKSIGLSALFLWSDLELFYQNLGFSSFSRENRFVFSKSKLKKFSSHPGIFCLEAPKKLSDLDINSIINLRPSTNFTLERSADEFRAMLTIPETYLLTIRSPKNKIEAFSVIGKGYDMIGVAHEWGATSPELLLSNLYLVAKQTSWDEITVLAPGNLSPDWLDPLKSVAKESDDHDMAFCKIITEKRDSDLISAIEDTFIWGLDSI